MRVRAWRAEEIAENFAGCLADNVNTSDRNDGITWSDDARSGRRPVWDDLLHDQ